MPVSKTIQPMNGRRATSAVAVPIAQITTVTGATVFSAVRATAPGAWDLSDVSVGYIIQVVDGVSGEEYLGIIDSVNDGSNYVEVKGWIRGGARGTKGSLRKPADGSPIIIHKLDGCKKLLVDALDGNSGDVYIGWESTVTVEGGAFPGHPIAYSVGQGNHRLIVEAWDKDNDYINLMKTYVISAAAQEVSWIAM